MQRVVQSSDMSILMSSPNVQKDFNEAWVRAGDTLESAPVQRATTKAMPRPDPIILDQTDAKRGVMNNFPGPRE